MDPHRVRTHTPYAKQARDDRKSEDYDDAGSGSGSIDGASATPGLRNASTATAMTATTTAVTPVPQLTILPAVVAVNSASGSDGPMDQVGQLTRSAQEIDHGLATFGVGPVYLPLRRNPAAQDYFAKVFSAFSSVRVIFSEKHASAVEELLSAECLSKLTIEHLECVVPAPPMSGAYAVVDEQDKWTGMRLRALSGMLKFLDKCRKESSRHISVSLQLSFACRQEADDFHASWISSRLPLYDCLRNSKLVTDVRIEKFQGKADREQDRLGSFERPVSNLIPVLRSMKSLQRLALCDNDIDDGQAKELAEALRKIDSISFVDLRGNPIGDAGKAALEKLRTTRHSLTILY